MSITGRITGIKYEPFLKVNLKEYALEQVNINDIPTRAIVTLGQNRFAISRWVSPKRTRSYPYERVYNTLPYSKKVTIIPVVKDEGAAGARDFIQWDTVSLMSLLDVFVILAYYSGAEKANNKISKQRFDNEFIRNKIQEIQAFHSSALHWNLQELSEPLHLILDKASSCYADISKKTGVKLHSPEGISNFKEKIGTDVRDFKLFSRQKAAQAQQREQSTVHRGERLATFSKEKITIENYLGGQYFFTVDETEISNNQILLIESKHSKNAMLPSLSDIKDGLLKMAVYTNLTDVQFENTIRKHCAILKLTSCSVQGCIESTSTTKQIENFIKINGFTPKQRSIIDLLIQEAIHNKFIIQIRRAT